MLLIELGASKAIVNIKAVLATNAGTNDRILGELINHIMPAINNQDTPTNPTLGSTQLIELINHPNRDTWIINAKYSGIRTERRRANKAIKT